MCLRIKKNSRKTLATKPMHVWKLLDSENLSPYQSMLYKCDTVVKARMCFERNSWDNSVDPTMIGRGLHAYRTKKNAVESSGYGDKVVRMTIPAGAHYYIGDDGDIVSDTLVVDSLHSLRSAPVKVA